MQPQEQMLREAKTIAVVGLSSDESRPSYRVARYLQSKGYRIIPVNPDETEVLAERSYPSLTDVPEPVDMIDVFRRPQFVRPIVEEAVRLGIPRIWLQDGVIDDAAADFAKRAGVQVVMNDCTMHVHNRLRLSRRPYPHPNPLPEGEGIKKGPLPQARGEDPKC